MNFSKFLFLLLAILGCQLIFAQNKIDHIEPPHWWVGMKNTHLQLLIHGEKIGNLNPSIDYDGVTIERVTKVKNPNYLFVDLKIAADVKAGNLEINFFSEGKNSILETHIYSLRERAKDSPSRKGFSNKDVLYLITPDRFANGNPANDDVEGMLEKSNRTNKNGRHGGDIEGVRQRLDYLAEMGFSAIWLNPILENNMEKYSYHGYATTDYYKVDPRFGTNESYLKMIQEAKSKGIGLIMDIIVNHCGSNHWWMNDQPTDDWIHTWEEMTFTNHQKPAIQDPHAAEVDKIGLTDGWFDTTMPDLNQQNELMATYLIQNSIWWVEYADLAGIRMDTYSYADMDFMTKWTEAIMSEYPNFNIVGEEWTDNPNTIAYWQRGKQNPNGYTSALPSLMDFPLQMAVSRALMTEEKWGEGLIDMYEVLAMDFVYADPNRLVVFPDNHDMARFFAQMGKDYGLFQLGIAYFLTTRGTPQFYYGTEILMEGPDYRDDGLIRSDFPGGWADDAVNGFTGEGLTAQQKEAQHFMKKLLNWRKTATAIHNGKLVHFAPEYKSGVYVFFRFNTEQKIMVILNKNKNTHTLELERFQEQLNDVSVARNVLTGEKFSLKNQLQLPAKAPLILELK